MWGIVFYVIARLVLFREINRKNLGNFVNLITVGEIDNEKILEEF